MEYDRLKGHRLLALFLVGCLLFNYPLLFLFSTNKILWGIPILYIYIFVTWFVLIGLAVIVIEADK